MPISKNNMKSKLVTEQDEFDFVEPQEPAVTNRDALVARTGLTTANEFQTDIFAGVAVQIENYLADRPTESAAVKAVAGSGKTTTITAVANLIPRNLKACFLAFNKAIADELKERLPSHVEAKTLNGLGFGLLIPYLRGMGMGSFDVKANRTQRIMNQEMTFQQKDDYGADVKFLVNMCKSMGVVPASVDANSGVGVNNNVADDDMLTEICKHHGRMIDPQIRSTVYATVRKILAISFNDSNMYETGLIDFDDQKWLPVCKRQGGRSLAKPKYDIIFIDEVQDVNETDIALIKMVLKPNGIVIGVGDDNQAIYGFRGADTKAFENFQSSFNAKLMPLSITYRCGTELVKHAQELVPTIQAAPNAQKGAVEHMTDWSSATFKPQDLVLCRNNAPLIEFAYKLIKDRVPVYVKGRNIGDGLIRIINDCVAEKTWVPNPYKPGKKMPVFSSDKASVTELAVALATWRATQIDLIKQDDPDDEAAIQRIDDQYDSIHVFMAANTDNSVKTLIEDINSLFSDDDNASAVVCSTIHKSKGLEADRVFMFKAECMYPKYVEKGTWQWKQEINLDYVARTRGKELYAYLHGEGK